MPDNHPLPLVVAITLGNRDLQVLVKQGEKLLRLPPDRPAEFHRALLDKKCRGQLWAPTDPDSELAETSGGGLMAKWDGSRLSLEDPSTAGYQLATQADLPEAGATEADVWLVPGIVWRELAMLRSEIEHKTVALRRLILFHTHRDASTNRGRNEPKAAPPLLKAWLPDYLGVSADVVCDVAYLVDDEDLYAVDLRGDRVFLPAAADRINEAIRKAAKEAGGGAAIRLHDSGGIPGVPDVLRSAARFYFPGEVDYLPPTEGEPRLEVSYRVRSAVDILETRRRACELVRSGQFEAAAGMAGDFKIKGADRSAIWQRSLEAAGDYFQGYVDRAHSRAKAKSLSGSRISSLVPELLKDNPPNSFHVAMRAEAALRAGDVVRAGLLTVTFYDVAIEDAVRVALGKSTKKSCFDKDGMVLGKTNVRHSDLVSFASEELFDQRGGWVAPDWINAVDEGTFRLWLFNKAGRPRKSVWIKSIWHVHVLIKVIPKFSADRQALSDALYRLFEAVEREADGGVAGGAPGYRPADFRNLVAHSVAPQAEIKMAATKFVELMLWHESDGARSFLDEENLPAKVLHELGVPQPRKVYDGLVEGVIEDIHCCPLYP